MNMYSGQGTIPNMTNSQQKLDKDKCSLQILYRLLN